MKKPSLDRIKKMTAGYIPGEFRDEILQLIKYIESSGQVRSEAVIREVSEKLKPISDHWKGYIACLEWVLEDPAPKPIEKVGLPKPYSVSAYMDKQDEIIDRLNEITKE